MKVSELIELLKQVPQDAEVITEGCDCMGEANGLSYSTATLHEVVIVRTPYEGDLTPPSVAPICRKGQTMAHSRTEYALGTYLERTYLLPKGKA